MGKFELIAFKVGMQHKGVIELIQSYDLIKKLETRTRFKFNQVFFFKCLKLDSKNI